MGYTALAWRRMPGFDSPAGPIGGWECSVQVRSAVNSACPLHRHPRIWLRRCYVLHLGDRTRCHRRRAHCERRESNPSCGATPLVVPSGLQVVVHSSKESNSNAQVGPFVGVRQGSIPCAQRLSAVLPGCTARLKLGCTAFAMYNVLQCSVSRLRETVSHVLTFA